MKNSNNPSFRPGQREVDEITKRARKGARDGAVIGGTLGYVGGAVAPRGLRKARLAGAGVGAGVGYIAGKAIGRKVAAKDDIASRKALRELAEIAEDVAYLTARAHQRDGLDFETVDGATAKKPLGAIQRKAVPRPSVRGQRSEPGLGRSSEAEFFSPARQAIAERWGTLIAESLDDSELDDEHANILHDAIQNRMAKANGPHASTQNDPEFERHFLASKIGEKQVSEMPDSLVHCNFLHAVAQGELVEFGINPPTTDLAILNRSRTPEGTFAPDDQVSSAAVRKAYSRDSVTAKAASSDPHTGRDATLAGAAVGAAGLGLRAYLKGRKGSRLKLPLGVAKLPGIRATTKFSMGHPGTYKIRRANNRGKKPPTHVHPRQLGKKKPTNLGAFLIHDDAFPIVPQPGQKLDPGTRRRVSPARTRKDVLARLKEITALASNFSVGSAVAETLIDAAGLESATAPKKKRLLRDANGNILNPQFLKDPGTTSTSSFASAIERLHEFGFGSSITSGAGRFLPEVAAIGAGDVIGESLHDRLKAAQDKKKRRLMRQSGGVEPLPGMGTAAGTMTTMSAVHDTLNEFAHGKERVDRAKRTGTTIAAAGAGGALGAYAGLRHEPGHVAQPGEIQPGSTVYRRREGFIPTRHYGVVDESGRVAHRTAGSSKVRNVTTDSFRKLGKGRTYVESPRRGDRTPSQIAAAASAAKGTNARPYSTISNNCEHLTGKLSGGKPVSRQVRRGVSGLVGGAVLGGTMAEILNRKNRKDK